MKATLKNYRQAPRKVRLIADIIKGKRVDMALAQLDHLIKRGSLPMKKLLLSAVANSKKSPKDLTIDTTTVDKGVVLKRMMPRAMGRGFPIHKHTSHITINLKENK